MKNAFSLIEILIALAILGIIAILSAPSLLKTYELHILSKQKLDLELQAHNALLQVKKILQDSIQPSLQIIPQESLSQTPTNLKNKSLLFYPKIQESLLIGNYSLPCLHGIFDPKSFRVDSTLHLNFLPIKADSTSTLNQNCKIYAQNAKLRALFVPPNFIAPRDFYNPNYTAEILSLNATSLQSTIPQFLESNSESNSQNVTLLPKVYFLSTPYSLNFSDKITLEKEGKTHILLENLDSFFLSTSDFGILLKLCVKRENSQKICLEDFIMKEAL